MGYKGQRKIMKRVAAPKQWYLGKLKGVYAVRPSPGPHKKRECIPMSVLLHQRLKLALNTGEVMKIVKNRSGLIKVDGKIRRDPRYPLGINDVVSIDKTNKHYRILIDTKGRFIPHKIDSKEAGFKLAKVTKKYIGKSKVPYIATHDGRTMRFQHPDICLNDTVKINLAKGEIEQVVKFQNGAMVLLTGGNNIGRIGILESVEKHPGSFEIAKVRDSKDARFSTRLSNIFVIGDNKNASISLPSGEGIKLSLLQEMNLKGDKNEEVEEAEDEEN